MTTLADFRAERGLTLEQMAVELELSAKSRGWLSEIERGVTDASLRLALRIQRWSGGRVTAGSVCKELADHADGFGVGSDNVAPDARCGAENAEANISRTSAASFGHSATAKGIADPDSVDGAVSGDAVVGSVAASTNGAAVHGQIDKGLPRLTPAGIGELNSPEVRQSNFDPAGPSNSGDRLDAEAVTVADIDDTAGEGLARPGLDGHGAAIRNAGAWIGQGRCGEQETKEDRKTEHAATVPHIGAAA